MLQAAPFDKVNFNTTPLGVALLHRVFTVAAMLELD
jgi:hypothetical protein